MKILARTAVLVLVAVLASCASSTNAIVQSIQYAIGKDTAVARAQLNPNFSYLRATIEGRVVLLVLGYVDDHPHGPVHVWYSAQREVLRLQNGRIVGAVGLNAEWREVVVPALPAWNEIAASGDAVRWIRVRDVMPGYRFGVRDPLVLRAVAAPMKSALVGLDPDSLAWFEERFDTDAGAASPDTALPPARYAVARRDGKDTVVYSEQCVAITLCFSWQVWPATPQAAKATQ